MLESVLKIEGCVIYFGEDGVSVDIVWVYWFIVYYCFDEKQLEEEVWVLLEEYFVVIIELGDWLWWLDVDVVSCDEVLV